MTSIAAQRKFLAQPRSEAIRNRPPIKNQLRNQMMTYLKHVGNFKHSGNEKTKEFEEITRSVLRRLRVNMDHRRKKLKKSSGGEYKKKQYQKEETWKYPSKNGKTECLGTQTQAD
ncbi:hypothetical protein Tco_0013240 [Tanacetum coccineum]